MNLPSDPASIQGTILYDMVVIVVVVVYVCMYVCVVCACVCVMGMGRDGAGIWSHLYRD